MWRSRISTRQKCGIFFMFPVRWVLLSNPNPNPNQVASPPLPLALRRRVICPLLSIFYALSEWNVSVGCARLPLSLGLGYALGTYWLMHIAIWGPPSCVPCSNKVRAPAAAVLGALLLLCRADLRIAQLRTRRDLGRQDLQRPCRVAARSSPGGGQ